MDSTRRGLPDGAGANLTNLISFACQSIIKSSISTAIPVRVDAVESSGDGAGYVSATPLVAMRDNEGNSLGSMSIPKLPFFRYYAGRCAIVCDPVVGDIGLAIFAQQDCSLVSRETNTPTVAGSFRTFDMADGFYIGGFFKGGADTSVVFEQSGSITINAPSTCKVVAKNAQIVADSLDVTCPTAKFSGNVLIDGTLDAGGDVVAGGLSFRGHAHNGVTRGNQRTDNAT